MTKEQSKLAHEVPAWKERSHDASAHAGRNRRMLWFVGLGISGFDSIPNGATGRYSGRGRRGVSGAVYQSQSGNQRLPRSGMRQEEAEDWFKLVKRWQVEDGAEILRKAPRPERRFLLSYGDPFVATTHAELRTRAAEQGIKN